MFKFDKNHQKMKGGDLLKRITSNPDICHGKPVVQV